VPNVPTVAEAGVPGYEFTIWFSMFAPAGTPKPIIDRLNQEIVKALAEPEMRQKLAATGVNAGSSTPEELGKHLRAEVAKWAKIIKAAGIPIN
jgi:tripartite-type tricarboxylate transporter receptor subunit TctC